MAKQTIVQLTDDIDGSEATQTVSFAYQGTNYEIDLSDKNATAMDKAISKYIEHATKVRGAAASTGRGRANGSSSTKRTDLSDIRSWAREQGYEVSERGRIAAEITEAYDAAH